SARPAFSMRPSRTSSSPSAMWRHAISPSVCGSPAKSTSVPRKAWRGDAWVISWCVSVMFGRASTTREGHPLSPSPSPARGEGKWTAGLRPVTRSSALRQLAGHALDEEVHLPELFIAHRLAGSEAFLALLVLDRTGERMERACLQFAFDL